VGALTVQLTNTSTTVWVNRADDSGHVAVWLLDADGARLPASNWIAFGGTILLDLG
jgi:hypothetical protein